MLIYKAFAPFRCTSVPSRGDVRSGVSRAGDSFQQLNRHIIPILYNAFKSVLRLVLLYTLILLHLRNKTVLQGKSQSHNAEINTNRSRSSLYNVLYSAKVFHQFFKANLNEIGVKIGYNFQQIFEFQNCIWRGFQKIRIIFY